MYKEFRNQAGLTMESAAERIGVSPRTLAKYESGEIRVADDIAILMAKAYKIPELTAYKCKYDCAIGRKYCYEILNNVDLSPVAILAKFKEEQDEAYGVLGNLISIVLNKKNRDCFTDIELFELKVAVKELLDVEHVIETLKLQLWDFIDVGELIEEHNEKCFRNKYTKKEPVLATQAQ